ERLRGDADRRRGLSALEFVRVDELEETRHEVAVEAGRGYLVDLLPLLDVELENGVEHLVRRQRVLIRLIRTQLGRRRLRDRRPRDHLAVAVQPVGDAV